MSDQNLFALNMKYGTQSVQYFYKQGKLTEQQFNQISNVIKSLFRMISESQRNFNTLNETMRALKKELNTAKFEYQTANTRQAQVTDATAKLNNTLKSAEVAYESQKNSHENLIYQCEGLEKDVINLDQKIKEDFRLEREKMQPTIQRYLADIQEAKTYNDKTRNSIESAQRMLEENTQKMGVIKARSVELLAQEEQLNQIKLKIKDSPQHYAKSAQNLIMEIKGMQSQLKDVKEEIERKQRIQTIQVEKKIHDSESIQRFKKEREEIFLEHQGIATEIDALKNNINAKEIERRQLNVDTMSTETEIVSESQEEKYLAEKLNKAKKDYEKCIREYKKQQVIGKQHKEIIVETEIIIEKLEKQYATIKSEIRQHNAKQSELRDDISGTADKTEQMIQKTSITDDKRKQIEADIRIAEASLGELRKSVINQQNEIKDAATFRESMARKASVAASAVRETQQELKVKELTILDLTKKKEETEKKLEHFKLLYEQVKSARNKYVTLIQNSSQDLAQLKERIKILQNELEILKNESAQKNKSIQEYNKLIQEKIHRRDQSQAQFNHQDLEKRRKKQIVDQNINEIEKLNIIINSLHKDMKDLREQYEEACQNRNHTGVQLIDRNDELCVLYEKANQHENRIRQTDLEAKSFQDQIRMIRIQIGEMDRKIHVAKQRLSQVPGLAQQVLSLQKQIQEVLERERELTRQLEDPENKERWRKLQGEDPDKETLDAKISILEERLNSKKQQLLEKELVLDEVTNLSGKLKTDAVDGRKSTLQISEKINEFQSRLRELTRKMKATIAELSMCQASIIKYQSEREQLQATYEQARHRMEEGLAPTLQTQIEYLNRKRDSKRHEEERIERLKREAMEQQYPPFAVKTTAPQRVNSYIPDEIGLPKPYGGHQPFMYQPMGSNMRHIRKPKIKEVDI